MKALKGILVELKITESQSLKESKYNPDLSRISSPKKWLEDFDKAFAKMDKMGGFGMPNLAYWYPKELDDKKIKELFAIVNSGADIKTVSANTQYDDWRKVKKIVDGLKSKGYTEFWSEDDGDIEEYILYK